MDWKDIITSPQAQLMAGTGLLAGGLSAYSGAQELRPGETKSERRKRIMRDAIVGGALGTGAAGLGSLAHQQFSTAIPNKPVREWVADKTSLSLLGLGTAHGGASVMKRVFPHLNFGQKSLEGAVAGLYADGPSHLASNEVVRAAGRILGPEGRLKSPDAVRSSRILMDYFKHHNPTVLQRGGIHNSLLGKLKFKLLGASGARGNAAITGTAALAPFIPEVYGLGAAALGNARDAFSSLTPNNHD